MTLANKVEQFDRDADIAHDLIHGPVGTVVQTEGGPVRSFATVLDDFLKSAGVLNLSDYAALRAYAGPLPAVYVTGYLVTAAPSGIAGLFVRDDKDKASADDGGLCIVTANGTRWKRSYTDEVNVQWFGAKGNTLDDDTAAITAADKAASACKDTLFLPAATYMTDALTATTSWRGEKGTIIKYRGVNNIDLVTARAVDGIVFRNLVLDGSVSGDPIAWTKENHDAFTGASGLSIHASKGAKVIGCRGQNMLRHSFRFVSCVNATWESCESDRNRGAFGDGFIAFDSIGLMVEKCRAYDFTRIGFVADTFGADPHTGYHMTFRDCIAEYGHDSSVTYLGNGDGEYNAGAWIENSAHATVDGLTVKNLTSPTARALYLTTGVKNNGVKGAIATFNATNLRFEYTGLGIVSGSLGDFPISVKVSKMQAYGVRGGTMFTVSLPDDNFSCTDSHVEVDFTINPTQTCAYGYGVTAGVARKGRVTFADCTVAHRNEDLALLDGYYNTTSAADIGSFSGDVARNGVSLTVRNVKNIDSTKPIWIGIPWNQATDLNATDCYVKFAYAQFLDTGKVHLSSCRIHSGMLGNGSSAGLKVTDCDIEGQFNAGGAYVHLRSSRVSIADAGFVWLFTTATNKKPAIIITDTYFEKDVKANGKVLRTQFGASSNTVVVSGSQFYNTGAAEAVNTFIEYAPGQTFVFGNVLADASVTNIIRREDGTGPTTPVGVTATTFH